MPHCHIAIRPTSVALGTVGVTRPEKEVCVDEVDNILIAQRHSESRKQSDRLSTIIMWDVIAKTSKLRKRTLMFCYVS